MKILQLVTKRQFRGAEVFAANLSEELIKLGHEIIFVGLYKNKKDILEVEGAVNIDLIEEESSFSVPLIKKIVSLVQVVKPEIIQCNGSDTLKYMVSASIFLPKIPILYRNISMISEWVNNKPKQVIYRKIFKRIAHVSSVGEEAVADFIKTFDYPIKQTSVIRRGIPIKKINRELARQNLRKELNLKLEDKIVMHIGNFSLEKNHFFLVDVFSLLKSESSNIKLVFIGTGILLEETKKEVKKRGLEETIFFLGFRKDIAELLSGADLFVLSSKVEGVPGVILEAASQGIPAIATDVGGVREVLKNGETGYVIHDFDQEDFKNKILKLAADDPLRQKMGQKAYALVMENFNPEENAKKFEDLYIKLKPEKSNNLRILQLIQKKQYRGAEIFACQLSSHLVELGHEVEVLSIYDGIADLPFLKVKSLKRPSNQRYYDVAGWKELARIIKNYHPDIVQANAADTLKYAVFSKLFFGWKSKIVFRNASASSYYINSKVSEKLTSFLLNRADFILSVSHASKEDLNKIFPFTVKKSEVISVGIEQEDLLNNGNEHVTFDLQKKNILHIGSFTKEKNHPGLIRIYKKVNEKIPSTVLHLIGDGSQKREIVKLVKEYSLEESVIFHGEIGNPYPYIKKSDLLVLPSLIEGLPAVLLEAMYYGTPVVAYNVGGIKEIVHSTTGSLIEANNEDAFIHSVIKNLTIKNQDQVETAHNMVVEQFLNEEITSKFIKFYKMLVNR